MREIVRRYNQTALFAIVLAAMILVACGIVPPGPENPTVSENIYQSQAVLQGVYESIAIQTRSGALAGSLRDELLAAADDVDAGLAGARALLVDGDHGGAFERWRATNAALLALERRLSGGAGHE